MLTKYLFYDYKLNIILYQYLLYGKLNKQKYFIEFFQMVFFLQLKIESPKIFNIAL